MEKNKKIINIIKVAIFLIALVVGFLCLRQSRISELEELKRIILDSKEIAPIAYIGLFTTLPAFFCPVTILAMAAGYVFGMIPAAIYTFIAAFINSTITYTIGKYVAHDLINEVATKKYGDVYQKSKQRTHGKDGFIMMLIVRLLPFVPYTFLNYMSGAIGYDYVTFIISSMLGILPGIFIYSNIGTNLSDIGSRDFYMSIIVFVVFLTTTTIIAKKYYGNDATKKS